MQKLQINDSNYEYYKGMFEIFNKHLWSKYAVDLPPEAQPGNVLETFEKKSKTLAKRILKEGLRESISWIKEIPLEWRQDLNADLIANNYPDLNSLNSRIRKMIERVIKRKKINNLDEFYTIKEEVIDQTSALNDEERRLLDEYLYNFEFKKDQKK